MINCFLGKRFVVFPEDQNRIFMQEKNRLFIIRPFEIVNFSSWGVLNV